MSDKVDITNPTMNDIIILIAMVFLAIGTLAVYPAGFLTASAYIDIVYVVLAYVGIQAVYQYVRCRFSLKRFDLFPGLISDKFLVGATAIVTVGWLAMNMIVSPDWYIEFVIWILGSLGLLKLTSLAK